MSAISCNYVQVQGDQIGRTFAHWEILYFGKFFFKLSMIALFNGKNMC
jgi:hypothetical protein